MSGTLSLHREGVPWWAFTRDPDDELRVDRGSCRNEVGPMAITVSEEVPGESIMCLCVCVIPCMCVLFSFILVDGESTKWML